MIIRPGPGKIAVKKLDLSQEIPVLRFDGSKTRLHVVSSESTEGIIAEVVFNAKPWIEEGLDRVHNPEYDIGDIVVIGRWTGTKLNINREEYIILREEDVLCSLSEKPLLNSETVEDDLDDPDERAGEKAFQESLRSGDATPPV